MPRRTSILRYAVAASALVTLTGCGGTSDEPHAGPTPTATTSVSASPSASGGTADAPEVVRPSTAPLDWKPVRGSVDDTVTRNTQWSLTLADGGEHWTLSGPRPSSGAAPSGWQVGDTLLDEQWAVVVLEDKGEQRPSRATVTDLATGKSFRLDGTSDVPTTHGGTWALGAGRLLHATISDGAYCLASVDLAHRHSAVSWCAPPRTGFNAAHATEAGDALLTFDDSQPACRTVVTVADGRVTPFEGVAKCKAWEGVATPDGGVWSIIPREQHVEEAHLYARAGGDYVDLGPSTASTLVWCHGAAYFDRDPQREGAPAALMRWSPAAGLTVAYESARGDAFLEAPRCGGDTMTVTARTSAGDEQVSAAL